MNKRIKDYLFYFSAILLLFAAALYLTEWAFIPYLYAAASVGVAFCYLSSPYRGNNFRLKRLNIQQAIAAILLPVSAFFMIKKQNEWFLFLAISAVLQLYIVIVKNHEEKKGED